MHIMNTQHMVVIIIYFFTFPNLSTTTLTPTTKLSYIWGGKQISLLKPKRSKVAVFWALC